VVAGERAPEFARPVHITFHNHQRDGKGAPAEPQELRLQLFDTTSSSSSTVPRLLASSHVLLEDLVFELGHECSFPWAGFEHSPNLGDTPSITLRATIALAREEDEEDEEDVLRTPRLAGIAPDSAEVV